MPSSKKQPVVAYGFESPADRSKTAKANARRHAKLGEKLQQAIRSFENTVASGQFFAPVKRRARKAPQASALKVTVRTIGAITITTTVSQEPFHRYESFKEKMKTEGMSVSGAITFKYINAAGDLTNRTVSLSKAYPIGFPEYVLGHCLLRNEERTFSIDRIIEPCTAMSGQPIYDLCDWLRRATDV